MPRKKDLPGLRDLCINNISQHIVLHGEWFNKCRKDEKLYEDYKLMQYLFSDTLLQKFFAMFSQKNNIKENFKELKRSMTDEQKCGNPEDWPCLKLLFNEYTTSALPSWRREEIVAEKFALFIASECKNLRRINEKFTQLISSQLCRAIPVFQNLLEVKLGILESGAVVKEVLKRCLCIKKLTADGRSCISDEILFVLCKHCSQEEKFIFCPDNGHCTQYGKHLEILYLLFKITDPPGASGIACALQHLPKLNALIKLPVRFGETSNQLLPNVLKGIMILQNAAKSMGGQLQILELTDLLFDNYLSLEDLNTVTLSCPKLQAIQVNLYAVNLKFFSMISVRRLKELYLVHQGKFTLDCSDVTEFLSSKGHEIETLNLTFYQSYCNSTSVIRILDFCCNLKHFVFSVINLKDNENSYARSSFSYASSLEKLEIHTSNGVSDSYCEYFHELLSKAEKLKYLTISRVVAQEFPRAMARNSFSMLEELRIEYADAGGIPLEKLVEADNNLRKVVLRGCINTRRLEILCKDISWNKNFELVVESLVCFLKKVKE